MALVELYSEQEVVSCYLGIIHALQRYTTFSSRWSLINIFIIIMCFMTLKHGHLLKRREGKNNYMGSHWFWSVISVLTGFQEKKHLVKSILAASIFRLFTHASSAARMRIGKLFPKEKNKGLRSELFIKGNHVESLSFVFPFLVTFLFE